MLVLTLPNLGLQIFYFSCYELSQELEKLKYTLVKTFTGTLKLKFTLGKCFRVLYSKHQWLEK